MGAIYFCLGLVVGGVLMNLAVEEERRKNRRLNREIDGLEEELNAEIFKKNQRDELIKKYQKDQVILLENAKEQRAKQKDLENNIELLSYNIPEIKKELVTDDQSNN